MDYREGLIHHIRKQAPQGHGINQYQRRVLQRRKNHIAQEVEQFAEKLITNMKEHGMINDETSKALKEEKSPSGQVILLIETILVSQHDGCFDVFMDSISRNQDELVTELRIEVRYEEGVAGVNEDVAKEAATLVHRKFGTSKRWGEGDKKDIIDLLAVKIQLLDESWQSKIDVKDDLVVALEKTISQKERLTSEMVENLHEFVKCHNRQLTNYAHGMLTTTQHISDVFNTTNKDTIEIYQDAIKEFLKRVDHILYHRDGLMEERSNCMEVLGIKDERNSLDRVLKQKLTLQSNPKEQSDNPENENPDYIKQLNRRLTNAEDLLEQKDQLISELQQKLANK